MAAAGAAAPGGWSAASVQPMVDLQAAAIPDDTDVRRQIVQAVRLQWRDGVGDARLTLQPEHLGDVTIALRVAQGGVSIHVSAETPEVRAWMNANELSLRQGLAQHGLTLDRLIVSDEPADAMPDRDRRRRRAGPRPPRSRWSSSRRATGSAGRHASGRPSTRAARPGGLPAKTA
jgi:flagellar hook-length control protein FliK